MLNLGRRNILGVSVDAVDYEAAVERIMTAARNGEPLAVSALAVHGVMTGALDPVHRFRLNAFGLIVPDGQPVRWAMRWLYGVKLPSRVYGPELMRRVCAAAAADGVPIFLYGSRPEVLAALETRLRDMFPGIVISGSAASRFRKAADDGENAAVLAEINATQPGIVFVGLGCPRQEVFAFENAGALSRPVLAVGAAFDFHAGLLAQAPKWMQDRGLEWLFRLGVEPKRLWRRYLILNPLFLWTLARQRLAPARFDRNAGVPPSRRENFI
jgi:exopolysaccharide biosynthesis WecB/TagA/CpsF family protein